jgi:hypothetical protein
MGGGRNSARYNYAAMKLNLLLAVLTFIVPVYGEQKSAQPTGNQQQIQAVHEPPSPPSQVVVIEQEHPRNQGDSPQNHSKSYLYELVSASNLPNILLFFAGLGGIGVAVYTLRDIRAQTRLLGDYVAATRDTVAMMKDANTQWVEIQPNGLFTRTEVGQPDPPTIVTINPRWKIINKTPLPLTVKTVVVQIAVEEGWKTYVFEFDEIVSPAPNDNSRSFFAPFKLNTKETTDFLHNCIELSISMAAVFVGTNGREIEQHFGDLYVCSVGRLEINYPIGKGPQHEYIEKYKGSSTIVEETGFRTLEPDDFSAKRN